MPEFGRWKADEARRQAELREAYVAGAEAMRVKAAQIIQSHWFGDPSLTKRDLGKIISDLPLPEPPERDKQFPGDAESVGN
jgi:hypothetical protein